jgi:hypothetical protein
VYDRSHILKKPICNLETGCTIISGGSSIYSNSKSIVNSYASIIESYWKQTMIHDHSDQLHVAEEHAKMKQYLNEVLKEVSNMRNKGI